jgi:four helix bundle protein
VIANCGLRIGNFEIHNPQSEMYSGGVMEKDELQRRTKQFALAVIRFDGKLPRSRAGMVIGNQLLRAATSVGANYRSACRARSHADFIAKIAIVEEEADECAYWLELVQEAGLLPAEQVASLLQEARELTAIFTASGRTAKSNRRKATA